MTLHKFGRLRRGRKWHRVILMVAGDADVWAPLCGRYPAVYEDDLCDGCDHVVNAKRCAWCELVALEDEP